jgi:hypothetical protein
MKTQTTFGKRDNQKLQYLSTYFQSCLLNFTLLIACFACSIQSNVAQDVYYLKEIITGSYNVYGSPPEDGVIPDLGITNSSGGSLDAVLKIKSGASDFCQAEYQFVWQFETPIDTWTKGQQIKVDYYTDILGSGCQSASGKMIVTESVGVSPQFKALNLSGIAGFSVANKKWQSETDRGPAVSTISLYNTGSKYATIKLNFESTGPIGSDRLHYEVVYLFEKNSPPTANCDEDLNCHNLYSLGVLVGFAEYGASKNDSGSFLADQIDSAIKQAEASNCVPTDELKVLSKKLRNSTNTKALHSEVSSLRIKIAEFVEKHCNCCSH